MKAIAVKDRNFQTDYVTANILDCVNFWNREGAKIIAQNISGELGSETTNKMAKNMQPDDFLLDMLLTDCETFCQSSEPCAASYEVGRTRSHVWIHQNNDRVLMIHF